MDEAGLCNRVGLIQTGKILSINTPAGIVNSFSKPLWAVKSERMHDLLKDLLGKDFIENAYPFGEFHHVITKDRQGEQLLSEFIAARTDENAVLQKAEADIEDCFIDLMR